MEPSSITVLEPRAYGPQQRGVPKAEAALQDAVSAMASIFAPEGCRPLNVVPELDAWGSRPDFWIGSFNETSFRTRALAGIDACTAPFPLAVACMLRRHGETSVDRLSAPSLRLGDRRRVQRAISELVNGGLALREGESVALDPRFEPADPRGVGVETKVGRWRRAVRQAQMWRPLMNGVWLVFPRSYISQVPRQRPGVRNFGIAVVDEGHVEVVRRPRLIVGRPLSRMLLEEHLYARWLADVGAREPAIA